MFGITETVLENLKREFPKGTIVEAVSINDPYRDIPYGTKGKVIDVDDIGTIHVQWENGVRLGVCYGEDECRKV